MNCVLHDSRIKNQLWPSASLVKSLTQVAPNPQTRWLSSRLAVAFAQSIQAKYWVENGDVVGAAPTGDAPTTPEWSTILLPTEMRLILDFHVTKNMALFKGSLFKW